MFLRTRTRPVLIVVIITLEQFVPASYNAFARTKAPPQAARGRNLFDDLDYNAEITEKQSMRLLDYTRTDTETHSKLPSVRDSEKKEKAPRYDREEE